MGSLLGMFKNASVLGPGGCKFSLRPIDIHLKMFKTVLILPAHIQNENTFGENICSLMVDITNIFSKLSGVFTCS